MRDFGRADFLVNLMKYSPESLRQMKRVRPIAALTAYTCPVARCLEKAGIPLILVGDSVGMVEMGFDTTRSVTIGHMEYHVGAARRGAPATHIMADMPCNTDRDPATALCNARLLLAAGADSVKLEGPKCDVIRHLVRHDIAVAGHTGLTPQTASNFRQAGVERKDAARIYAEAGAIAEAGAFLLVLEHIPADLAASITAALSIPTIGIGAGPDCDGQVLVINDAAGLGDYWPPFSKQYADLGGAIQAVAGSFLREVEQREFPHNIIQLNVSDKG